jgi:hypothetical protein
MLALFMLVLSIVYSHELSNASPVETLRLVIVHDRVPDIHFSIMSAYV